MTSLKSGRGYKALLLEAELLAKSPEAVADFLINRAGVSDIDLNNDLLDEEGEKALLGRNNPLIDLSLARYGFYGSVVSTIFNRFPYGHAARLAALCNTNVYRNQWLTRSFPVSCSALFLEVAGLFETDEKVALWLNEAPDEEIQALFGNQALEEKFLLKIFQRSEDYEKVSDKKLQCILRSFGDNSLSKIVLDGDRYKYAYDFIRVFDTIWKLAETAEATEAWAKVLGDIYQQLPTVSISIGDPLAAARCRWADGGVNHDFVRKGLGRIALDKGIVEEILNDEDRYIRYATYTFGKITPAQVMAAYQMDGVEVYSNAKFNDRLWRTETGRSALKDVAYSMIDYKNDYGRMKKAFPDWFGEEEDAICLGDDIAFGEPVESIRNRSEEERDLQTIIVADEMRRATSLIDAGRCLYSTVEALSKFRNDVSADVTAKAAERLRSLRQFGFEISEGGIERTASGQLTSAEYHDLILRPIAIGILNLLESSGLQQTATALANEFGSVDAVTEPSDVLACLNSGLNILHARWFQSYDYNDFMNKYSAGDSTTAGFEPWSYYQWWKKYEAKEKFDPFQLRGLYFGPRI